MARMYIYAQSTDEEHCSDADLFLPMEIETDDL